MKNEISFLLDENITPKAQDYLNKRGFKCNHIVTMGYSGVDDETVLNIAKDLNSCLCTMNGKDFVIQVVPKTENEHFGLFWIIDNVTRKNYTTIFDMIINFLEWVSSIKNKIIELKKESGVFCIKQTYPCNDKYLYPVSQIRQ